MPKHPQRNDIGPLAYYNFKKEHMENTVVTVKSNEVPEIRSLEAIDGEELLKKVLRQLSHGEFGFIAQRPGAIEPIEGYKTPLQASEIVLHISINEDENYDLTAENSNEFLLGYIQEHKLAVAQAVRHADGPYTRIVATIDAKPSY